MRHRPIVLGVCAATVAALLLAGSHVPQIAAILPGLGSGPPISAAPHRSPVESLEDALFAPPPFAPQEREQLVHRFTGLANALDREGFPRVARRQAVTLRDLARRSAGSEPLAAADVSALRTRWLDVRRRLFRDETWFLDGELEFGGGGAFTPRPLALHDRQQAARVSRAAFELERMLMRGRETLRHTSEVPARSEFEAARQATTSGGWGQWAMDWRADLDGIRTDAPLPMGAEYRPELRFANERLEAGRAAMRLVPFGPHVGGTAPAPSDWEPHFEEAHRCLRDARRAVEWVRKADRLSR